MTQPVSANLGSITPAQREPQPLAPLSQPPARIIPWATTWILLLSLSAIVAAVFLFALHDNRAFFIPILSTAVCILAALFDAWTTRIPNPLTYTAILLGLALSALAAALAALHQDVALRWLAAPSFQQSLLGFAVCAIVGLAGVIFARIGGGDIKLLAALGALLGLSEMGYVLVIALAVALAYALLNLALAGRLNTVARLLAIRLLEAIYLRRLTLSNDDAPAPSPRRDMIPMAVPLAIGLIIAQALQLKARLGGLL